MPVRILIPFRGYFSINSSRSGLNITDILQAVLATADADLFSPSTRASSPKKSPGEKTAKILSTPKLLLRFISTSPSRIDKVLFPDHPDEKSFHRQQKSGYE